MTIYLYCLLRATREPPAQLAGIDGAAVRAVALGDLGAWVSDTAESSVAVTTERATAHDRVVRAALEGETPLPARFGQIVPDEEALAHAVHVRREQLVSALDRVAGAVEMTVRLLVRAGAGGSAHREITSARGTSGRDYLEQVAAAQREERNVLAEMEIARDRVRSVVRGLVRAESFHATPGSSMATLSHLVSREHIDKYRGALLVLRNEEPTLGIMVSGPWAPYSFTEGVAT
jgi:Gas vesicle synthesis protein GvpL/GvpF